MLTIPSYGELFGDWQRDCFEERQRGFTRGEKA
jgi:hypothetical protein